MRRFTMRSIRVPQTARAMGLAIGLGGGAVLLLGLPVLADSGSPPTKANGAAVGALSSGSSPAPSAAATAPASSAAAAAKSTEATLTMDGFLDRLMIAESGGNDEARNPLSTATGAYQFIEATFLSVMRRHFPERIATLDAGQILALRTDRTVARDAARAFTKDNATHLAAAGHKSTFPHLRLAFLLGAGGAVAVLSAKPETPLSGIVGPAVIRANPWMSRYTAANLVRRAAREVSLSPSTLAGVEPRRDPKTGKLIVPKSVASRPRIAVRCNLARPSCRRWLSLERAKLSGQKAKKVAARSKR